MPALTVYRPGGTRYVAYGAAVVLVVMTVAIGVALPPEITFTAPELFTLALLLLAALIGLHGAGRSLVRADDSGIEVVNGYRHHRLPWSQVKGFAMNEGAPWPTLVTRDDERIILFALQGTDGPRAREALVELRRRLP